MGVTLTQEMINGAIASEKKYGVPASITLGQIMLESGGSNAGGLSGLAYNYNNLFGVTAGSSWTGKTVYMTNKNGTDGQNYRVYDSVEQSIDDHGKLLASDRYTKYTSNAKNISEYASAIKQAGYATDPNYATKLTSIIRQNGLTKYDGQTAYSIGEDGSLGVGFDGTTLVTNVDESTDLKWWGDIIVIVLSVLLIGLAVVFFVLSFNGGSIKNVGMNIANKATGGAMKQLQKVGK